MNISEELSASKAKVTALEQQVGTLPGLTTENASLKTEVATLKAQNAQLTTDVSTANAAKTKAEKDLTDANAAQTAALTARDAEVETKAATKAAAIVAAAGGSQVETKAAAKPGEENQAKPLKGLAAYKASVKEQINKHK